MRRDWQIREEVVVLGVLVLQHTSGTEPVDEEVVAAGVSSRWREQVEELQATWLHGGKEGYP